MRPWLFEIRALPRFPEDQRSIIAGFLAAELRGPEAPFATVVALEVYRWVPDLVQRGLLQGIVQDPSLDGSFVAFQALDALTAAPRPDDFRFLSDILTSQDGRFARRALRGLARSREGAAAIADLIARDRGRVAPAIARDLPEALKESRLTGDEDVMRNLLGSGDRDSVRAALRSYGWSSEPIDAPPGPVLGNMAALALKHWPAGDDTGTEAVAALAQAGPGGLERLREIAASNAPLDARLRALDALSQRGDDSTGGSALALLSAAEAGSQAALIVRIAARTGSIRQADLVQQLQQWLALHSAERDLFEATLSRARSDQVQAVLAATLGGH